MDKAPTIRSMVESRLRISNGISEIYRSNLQEPMVENRMLCLRDSCSSTCALHSVPYNHIVPLCCPDLRCENVSVFVCLDPNLIMIAFLNSQEISCINLMDSTYFFKKLEVKTGMS